jgi:hypothetical protein
MDGFKAIVIVECPKGYAMQRRDAPCHGNTLAYAFRSYRVALAFLRGTKAQTVIVEFDVEVETMDFCDAVKALKVRVIFSGNSLEPRDLTQYGLSKSDVVYPDAPAREDRIETDTRRPLH